MGLVFQLIGDLHQYAHGLNSSIDTRVASLFDMDAFFYCSTYLTDTI